MACVLETTGLKGWQREAVGRRYVCDLSEWAQCENNCPCVIKNGAVRRGCQQSGE